MIEDVGELGRFLGRHHTTISHDGHEHMRAYAKDMIRDYVNLTNTKIFKKAHTPFLAKVAEHLDDDEAVGELVSSASSIRMKLMCDLTCLGQPHAYNQGTEVEQVLGCTSTQGHVLHVP
jgi:hypothetical protein